LSASTRTNRELLIVGHRGLGVDHVPVLGDRRIIELQDEPGVDDGLVLLAHGIGAGEQKLFLGLVVPIGDPRGAAGGDRGHEALLEAGRLQRRLEVGDVGVDRRVARIRQLVDAHRPEGGAGPGRDARVGVAVGGRELHPVAPIGEAREHDLTGLRPLRWQIVEPRGAKLEPAQTLERVAPPRPVVHTVPHRLAELAVPGNGDAQVLLAAHDVPDARTELRLESTLVARLA